MTLYRQSESARNAMRILPHTVLRCRVLLMLICVFFASPLPAQAIQHVPPQSARNNILPLYLYLWDEYPGLTILLLIIFLAQSLTIAAMLLGRRSKTQVGQRHLADLVQKCTAELTEALEAAKLANNAKDEFLPNVIHELRTPLNVVIGLSDLARGMSKDPKQRDYLDKIADAGRQLSGIINDQLDLSKIVAGRMELKRTSFNLRELVQTSHSAMAHKAEEKVFAHYRDTRVLVVEDQPLNQEIVEQLLLAVGIVPRMASNGREALDILAEADPAEFDLILMDIQMPEMDGFTATREIRTRLGFNEMPIIAMTAHTMDREKQIGVVAGMSDHIGKPFEAENFYRILAKWLPGIKMQEFPDPLPPPSANNGLPALSGIDTQAGLDRFAGNKERYRHWLMTFINEAPGYEKQIRSALANGQPELARKTVHAIKGRVGLLGMNDLTVIAVALEAKLERGEPADDLLDRMQLAVRKMCDELQDAFGTAENQGDNYVPRNRSQEP